MKVKKFIKEHYILANLLGMALVVVVLVVITAIGLGIYTRHGVAVKVPSVRGLSMMEARHVIEEAGLVLEVSDSGYNKKMPADCVLEQVPQAGMMVKPGRVVSLIINAAGAPMKIVPDIVDNCSLREAMARLKSMGLNVGMPEFVEGEKDWVYGLKAGGRKLNTGDRVSIEETIIIQVGNGRVSDIEENFMVEEEEENMTFDDFEEL